MRGKILVIEDEKLLRANLGLLLQSEGHTVTVAADGQEGLQHLQQDTFDLVITDMMMGEIGGLQIMEHVAGHLPDTLVIAITGYASADSAISALRQGAYDYIPKPFEVEMIEIAVQRALDKVQLRRELKRHVEHLEELVAERTQELATMNHQLQKQLIQMEKLSALGELISGFAHEVNNPLSTVVGYAELLMEEYDNLPDEVRRMLETSHSEALRCHQIVRNLLGFARKQEAAKQYLDINTLCKSTLDLLAYQLKVNNIEVRANLEATPLETMVDGHQIQQVLVNICSNAYQAMVAQRSSGQLTLSTTADEAMIYLTITDTGPGIAPDHLPRIFDPFFTTKASGTGLGLSLSYSLIKKHHGEITVTCPPGQGTTFTIALPRLTDETSTPASVPTACPTAMPAKHMLVIDDEQDVASMVVDMLQALGHCAEAVYSGRQAMEKIVSGDYDLLLCDMKMPDVNGPQIYDFVQQHRPDVCDRVVFYSGDTVSRDHRAFFEETGCLFLSKPFLLAECQQMISRALNKGTDRLPIRLPMAAAANTEALLAS